MMQSGAAGRSSLQTAALRCMGLDLHRASNGRVCANSTASRLTLRSALAKHISVRVRGRRGTATEVCPYAAEGD